MVLRNTLTILLAIIVAAQTGYAETYRGKFVRENNLHFIEISGARYQLSTAEAPFSLITGAPIEVSGVIELTGVLAVEEIHIDPAASQISGVKKIAVRIIDYEAAPKDPAVLVQNINIALGKLQNYITELSHGKVSLETTIVGPSLAKSGSTGCVDSPDLRRIQREQPIDATQFDFVMTVFQVNPACKPRSTGFATLGGKNLTVYADLAAGLHAPGTMAHELLHSMGLGHSRAFCSTGQQPAPESCAGQYSDTFDIMGLGRGPNGIPLGVGPWARSVLGFFQAENVLSIDSPVQSGVYELSPLGTFDASLQAIRIPRGKIDLPPAYTRNRIEESYDFWISFRQPIGVDGGSTATQRQLTRGARINLNPRYPAYFANPRPAWDFSLLIRAGLPAKGDALGVTLVPGMRYVDPDSGLQIRALELRQNSTDLLQSRLKIQICLLGAGCPELPVVAQPTPIASPTITPKPAATVGSTRTPTPTRTPKPVGTPYFAYRGGVLKVKPGKPFIERRLLLNTAIQSCSIFPKLPRGIKLGKFDCSIKGTPQKIMKPTTYLVRATMNTGSIMTAKIRIAVVPRKHR